MKLLMRKANISARDKLNLLAFKQDQNAFKAPSILNQYQLIALLL